MRTQRCQERLGAPLRGSLCHNGHIHSRYASQVQTAIDVHRSWSYASWISVAPYPRIHWRAGSARCNALPSSRVGVAAGLMRIAGERRCTSAEAQKTHGVTRAPKISPPSTP
ncbi:hypothetical protein PsYK624_011850 [Phanerochaete sordida]|uniref:Uncharacterized protein n=1 Tax=Phanerochaete sordida TaxID=48140 RepID=A0A9P3L8K6_9APHY|nr:hypothetical protein PsYK624_011850 [Phanerochaete sordida]